ncbi:unannotated protein [freshwater metagenome]|uniref:Unannotated protein n=1 Tax=freshwater metagenome TaxID=449393 RepID=A0A6J7MUB4_9ZZZZ
MRRAAPTMYSGASAGRANVRSDLMSAPGQNIFSPVAVITAARTSYWPLKPLMMSRMPSRISGVIELPLSGRLMVIHATPFSSRYSSSSFDMGDSLDFPVRRPQPRRRGVF